MVVPLALLFVLIHTITKFKYILVIRSMGADGTIQRRDIGLARAVKDSKTGAYRLSRYFKRSDIIPMPPSGAVAPCMGSYKLVELYQTEAGEYGYIFPTLEVDEEQAKVITKAEFRPAERAAYVENLKEAHDRNSKSLLEVIAQIAPTLILALVIICGMLFYGKIANPLIQQAQVNTQMTMEINKLLKTYQNVKTNTVELEGDTIPAESVQVDAPPEVDPQQVIKESLPFIG